jgi:1-deoxy-D-xylulose-5-phosphate reductoisomerase
VQPALDWSRASTWEFQPLDETAFPAVRLARSAGEAGGVMPALFNAANEEAVAAFLAGRLSFPGIVQLVARTLDDAPDLGAPTCVEDVLAAEKWAREHARRVIGQST